MDGFKIAIATKDGELGDLISIGTDLFDPHLDAEGSTDEDSAIESAEIFFDTTDDDVRQKSGSMLAKIEIKGKILKGKPVLMKKLSKLSEWAHDRRAETTYRDICIGVKSGEDSFQVVYVIKNVFVVDYKESYALTDEQDKFELRLTQRENNLDKIEILSNWPSDQKFGRKG